MKYNSITIVALFFVLSHNLIPASYQLPFAAYSIDVKDIDLDGDKDIVVGHEVAWEHTNPSISILENNGFGEFDLIDTSMVFCGYQENIFIEKINKDEYPDIVAFKSDFETGEADRDIRIIYNEYGSFDGYDYKDFTLNSQDIFSESVMGDIDSDGDLDIMVCSNNSEFWGYMLNVGNGEFSLPVYYDLEYPPTEIVCGDLNNDGRDDFLVCNRMDAWLNLKTGLEHYVISEAIGLTGVDICDVDNDGDNDLVGSYLLRVVLVFLNDGAGNFEFVFSKEIDPWLSRTFISDINGDNYPDIIYNSRYNPNSEEARYTFIMYNNGNNSFTDPVKYQTYFGDCEYTASLVSYVEDIDGNGLKDLMTVNYSYGSENNLNILYQDSLGNFVEESQTGINDGESTIKNYKLFQNYPNPFNNITTIEYQLQSNSEIEIDVFNIKGQLIENLVKKKQVRGNYSVSYNANELNSGVYYYRLQAEGIIIDIKKMLLIK